MKIKVLVNIFLCRIGIRSVLPASVFENITVIENNEIMVDVSGIKTSNIAVNVFRVRTTVLEMLKRADKFLPDGHSIILIEGYRSLSEQKKRWERIIKEIKQRYPNLNEKEVELMAKKFSAKPNGNGPHQTGGAIDVSVCDSGGNLIDMGTEYSEASLRSYTKTKGLTESQKENRNMLVFAMKKAGFINYPAEWWHWCYGDKMWAAYSRKKFAIYGIIKGEYNDNSKIR